jgi:hypothetical protein
MSVDDDSWHQACAKLRLVLGSHTVCHRAVFRLTRISSLLLALLQPLELLTLVPAGGATMVEFKMEIPGTYILVDHSLSGLQNGAAGYLDVEGPPNPRVFQSILAGSQDGGSASQLQSS